MTDKPTTDADRHAAGMTVRRKVLGDAHVDRAIAATTSLTEDFQNLITRYAWGEIWSRPGLDIRTRRTLVIGTLVALGQHEELAMHVRAALSSGDLTADQVKEVVLQQAIYCGVPAANAAFRVVGDVIAEINSTTRTR
jgi:3-oxoadipate enol-lactonase/4-carboxymuconolactone decarboxylase